MRSLILYCSTYKKNTEKLAITLGKKIGADVVNVEDLKSITLGNYDLIGFGSGVYKESMSIQLIHAIEKLDVEGKDVFVFSTSGIGMRFYNRKIIKKLESKGARCRGDFACKGSFVSKEFSENKIFEFISKFALGHPNEKDFIKAIKFIEKITCKK